MRSSFTEAGLADPAQHLDAKALAELIGLDLGEGDASDLTE